ncbi:MAG: trimethylamine methyltransferase family protein [Paracoccaceae bacterium]
MSRRAERRAAGVPQRPWGQVPRRLTPVEVISRDQVETIHHAACRVLAETGLRVLDGGARDRFRAAGAGVEDLTVRLDPGLVAERLATVPRSFRLLARNPARNLALGGANMVFASVGGPAYVMDLARGRRDGTLAEMEDYLRLVQALNVIQQEGGGPFEPMDLPAATRHLDIYAAQIRLLDKNWQTQTLGRARTLDGIAMAAIGMGAALDSLPAPCLLGIINTNSPLQLDIPMAEGLIALAEHGQVNVITPFTLAGAMAPVSLAGALVLQHAEALAGIVLTQIVRPGVPVMYGGFTSNVDMASGAPAFGTPEYAKAAMASGQLARHIGVPFRSSNVTSANAVDAQASYESQMAIWGAIMGGVHLMEHAAGWMHGGLTASFEKLLLDAEMLQMMQAVMEPVSTDAAELALAAIAEVGPGGHFFGAAHTLDRYREAFHRPLLSDWSPHETWKEAGGIGTAERAAALWPRLLAEYQEPVLPADRAEELADYVARRKAEGGAPMN